MEKPACRVDQRVEPQLEQRAEHQVQNDDRRARNHCGREQSQQERADRRPGGQQKNHQAMAWRLLLDMMPDRDLAHQEHEQERASKPSRASISSCLPPDDIAINPDCFRDAVTTMGRLSNP